MKIFYNLFILFKGFIKCFLMPKQKPKVAYNLLKIKYILIFLITHLFSQPTSQSQLSNSQLILRTKSCSELVTNVILHIPSGIQKCVFCLTKSATKKITSF